MKKFLVLLLFVLSFLNVNAQEFLEPEDAFKVNIEKVDDNVNIKLVLGKDIYLYDDKIKVSIVKPQEFDITEEVNIPAPTEYDGFIVQLNDLDINIPVSLLKAKVDAKEYEIKLDYQGCSKQGLCYAPMNSSETIALASSVASTGNSATTATDVTSTNAAAAENSQNETDIIAQNLKGGNILLILATFFGFGLLLSLTPCIFPMIPILSSIIVGASQNEKMTASKGFFMSLVYVLAMSFAYTIAGVIAGIFGANLQVALQNPWVLSVFALVFVALAFSLFGYYEIRLPASLQSKIQNSTEGKEKQGIFGIAVMGFLSALIVGPCVAPPLAGALIYIGQTGDAVLGGAALFVMSIGMGIPLLLIGLGAGRFMPKPGGWMDSVSKVFGIVMLGIAVWMLDRIIDPIYTMYMWAILLIALGVYIKTYQHILIQILTVVFIALGVSVLVGALSGQTNPLKPFEKFTTGKVTNAQNSIKFTYVKNLDELNEQIKLSSKPVMLDFYADWCISCKELEGITFKDEKVIAKLNEFTLLKADVTKNTDDDKEMQKKFGVVGPPALIFWDKDNNEIKQAKIVGYKNPTDFLEIVNKNFK
jgi:thiol:disulfide interchange protein DsbD